MSNVTIEISPASHSLLKELAAQTGHPVAQVLNDALAKYQRDVFFEAMNAGYAELRADPEAWADHEAERKAWDRTLMDGLDSGEQWTENGTIKPPS